MSKNKIDILQRALAREKAARKEAEKILESKTTELYNSKKKLEKLNVHLESLLNKSNSQLQGVFENIIDAYVIIDLSGNILKMNKSALNLLGFETDNIDFNLMKMVYPNDYEKVAMSFKELMRDGFLRDFELEILTNRGENLTVHINASVIYQNNLPIAAQGIIRDISILKQNESISEVIKDITQSLLGTLDIYKIALNIAEKIAKYLKTYDCVIYAVNHFENQVEQIAACGDKIDNNGEILNKLKFSIGSGIVGTVAKTGVSELISDTSKDDRYLIDINRNYSEITVPIIVENEVIAIIDSEHPNKNYFNKTQLRTIENIADIIGLKIKNAISLNEKDRVQKKLSKSEERLRVLISSLESGILLEDQNRKIVLTNTKFCEMFGIPFLPENMIGADCTDAAEQSKSLFKNPDDFVARINSILQKKQTVIGDELVLVDGSILERDYIPLFSNNNYSGHLWNYRNVTLQKFYSESLEAQKQKYSNIIANMNLGLLEVDVNDKILMCNQRFLIMSGYMEEELLGKRASDIFLEKKSLKVFDSQSKKRLNGYSDSYEIEIKNKTGDKRIWLISGAPNYNLNGELIGTIGIHLDITDHKKFQIEKDNLLNVLRNKNEELQEYAQIVSHDLKSPLRNISALTTWIKEDNFTNLKDESLIHFDHLEQTLDHMEQLISGVLKYSKISSEIGIKELVDLNNIVFEIINILHVPDHISININNNLPTVFGDKIKFQQLFKNLINNAITHLDKKKGIISIGSVVKNKEYEFYIKDNGIGIDKKYHHKIFKMFYYLTKNKNSTGIGLSIVKKIVEIYGGKIWVESELGIGATFYFTIRK